MFNRAEQLREAFSSFGGVCSELVTDGRGGAEFTYTCNGLSHRVTLTAPSIVKHYTAGERSNFPAGIVLPVWVIRSREP